MISPVRLGKDDPRYWRQRLFRARYFYKGKARAVRNWSVKIQHQGRRKTLSLSSSRLNDAAAEACQIYRQLISRGWDAAPSSTYVAGDIPPSAPRDNASGPEVLLHSRKLSLSYWAQRS